MSPRISLTQKKKQKKIIVANWKMNPIKGSEARTLFRHIQRTAITLSEVETIICPPLIFLQSLGDEVTSRHCVLGAQDAFWEHEGAYTGQVSPDMIFYAKARYVIMGHSERRQLGDTSLLINKKIKSVLQFPLIPIICIGETTRDDAYDYISELKQQLQDALHGLSLEEMARCIIAYEPVWAIGDHATGHCLPEDVRTIVHIIRQVLVDRGMSTSLAFTVPILYGGSVNDENAEDYLRLGEVQGLLVGRTSLDSKKFTTMLKKINRLSLPI